MKIKAAIAGILALFAVASASAQQFPTVPDHSVIGRIGVGGSSGPSQAIPFTTLNAQLGSTTAPSHPIIHPSSNNLVGSGCIPAEAHSLWWIDQNLCSLSDSWNWTSTDPSALFAATIGGSVTTGDLVRLTFTFGTICAAGCNADYTTVGGDTLTKVAQGLALAIKANPSLFNSPNGGYAGTAIVGLVPTPSSAVLNFDFNSTIPLKLVATVNGAATETVTITNTTCGTVCSAGWDVNPTFIVGRLVAGVAPPPNAQIFGLVVQGSNSLTPSAFATQYGVLSNTVLSSTGGAVAARWGILTPNAAGAINQGVFIGAGLFTSSTFDNGVDSITGGTLTTVGTLAPVAGSGWSLLGGATPGSYCTNWGTGAWLPCSLFGLSWDFKPSNSATSGVTISANLVKPDATNVTALGATANRWSNVFSTLLDLTSSSIITQIAAPSSPAAGRLALWADSTSTNVLQTKNTGGTISNTVVADTGAANNFLTAISANGAISKAQPSCASLSNGATGCSAATGQFPGTATNDNASAGNVGEFISSTVVSGSAVALTTGTGANVTSIALTAGDWDVTAQVNLGGAAGTTVANAFASISAVSATLDATVGRQNQIWGNSNTLFAAATFVGIPVTTTRLSLSGSSTIFLVALASFGVSTANAHGIIRARRVR